MLRSASALLILALGACGGGVPPVAPSEFPIRQFESMLDFVLRDLSRFAREIDGGVRTLSQARDQDGMPDRLLTELRTFVHEHPSFGPRILRYLRSKEEPLTARALVVMALAQPDLPEIVELNASFLAFPPDMKLVTAWGIGFEAFRSTDWDLSYTAVTAVTDLPAWQISSWGWGTIQEPGRGPLDGLDFTPLLDALLVFVNRDDAGIGRALALMHARNLSRRPQATDSQRRRVQELARQSYLRADEAWGVAMDCVSAEVLAQGLNRVSIFRRMLALNEIATRSPDVLNRELCTAHIDEAIRYMSLTPQEGGPYEGSLVSYCWEIMNATGSETRAEFMLLKSPSISLRRRSVLALHSHLPNRDRDEWKRWTDYLERLRKDSDFRIAQIADWLLDQEPRAKQ